MSSHITITNEGVRFADDANTQAVTITRTAVLDDDVYVSAKAIYDKVNEAPAAGGGVTIYQLTEDVVLSDEDVTPLPLTEFAFPVVAGGWYEVTAGLFVTAAANGQRAQLSWAYPTNTVGSYTAHDNGADVIAGIEDELDVARSIVHRINLVFRVVTNGTITPGFVQATANAAPTTFKAGSFLPVREMVQ